MAGLLNASARIVIAPFDLESSLRFLRLGRFDHTVNVSASHFDKAFMTAQGLMVLSLRLDGDSVIVEANGEGAQKALDSWLALLPPRDRYEDFAPEHDLLRDLHRKQPGLRIVGVPWLFDFACAVILQQRIAFIDAVREWSRIVSKYGEIEHGRVAFPRAAKVAKMATWQFEELGVDAKRSRAMIAVAREEVMTSFLSKPNSAEALRARLLSIRGIGPWTTETIMGMGAGDTDALITGDLYLPHIVTWAFAGEVRGSDERMTELLEPYRPHRFRVTRYLYGAGITPPRTSDPRPTRRRG